MLTAQEIFDKVVTHFIVERNPIQYDRCRYRGEHGTKCAVGLFLTDEDYHPSMDEFSYGVHNLVADYDDVLSPETHALLAEHELLFQSLQRAHDKSGGYKNFRYELGVIAERFKLDGSLLYSTPGE